MKETLCHDRTIEILDAFNVIWMQRERFSVEVHGIHDSISDVGVI